MNFIEAMTTQDTLTANGAVTNSTTQDYVLDLFFLAGACRNEKEEAIKVLLSKAYTQDRIKCLKVIFWAGDIREGAGERRFFKIAINWLEENHVEDLEYISYMVDYSRWDVIFEIANRNNLVLNFILNVLQDKTDPRHNLLCKWLPRKKQYNNLADKIRRVLHLSPKQYRKMLVEGTDVVESKMCKKQWNQIEYSHVPSVALNKYTKAWYRNDRERFEQYIENVKSGKEKINAGAILPCDIIRNAAKGCYYGSRFTESHITQWNNLPNYLTGINSLIPVCDVSGSMYGDPIIMCLALGLYISERNEGPFKDAFFTFSENPKLQILKGSIAERVDQLCASDWGNNTNLAAVFDIILEKAKENNLSADMMPKSIIIISDMEFDSCARNTNYKYIKMLYEESGYTLPNIIFWNVKGRVGNCPVRIHDERTALVSGNSPSILKAILTDDISPIKIMNNSIEVERYSFIR